MRSQEEAGQEREGVAARLDSLWLRADELYQAGQFELALATLQEVETQEKQLFGQPSSRLHYYRGILQALTKQYRAALSSFERVSATYTEEAAWKRALILLRFEGRRQGAIRALRAIANSSTPRQGEARELLEKLGVEDR